ncbi:adenylate kinase family protein [Haloferula rosea]|uniref:Adenylate kinase n=1 Tax=Haloferula rosea TaxID=490093 RepID=A0A934V9U1_9BACT|nr:nucleoside monophosphate kinase [Haloferula rosea]MBK1825603.1 nucleoside monophosphate kinase [Haloferula rosea]
MALHLILLGPPASGKGTQGRRLAEREELAYLSTGALLREVLRNGGPVADEVRPTLAVGGYVSDSLMCDILEDWLARHEDGWVLDGFPRTVAQDDFLKHWLAAKGQAVDGALALEVPKAELVQRIEERVECPSCGWSGQTNQLKEGFQCPSCGEKAARRDDDSLENFMHRFEEYKEHTVPVIERYRALGMLAPVDASEPIDVVSKCVEQAVNQLKSDGQKA